MPIANKSKLAGALAVTLSITLGACNTMPQNRELNSVNQPVVERTNYTLDLTSGPDGLTISEQRRLADWFDAMELRFGDRVSIDDPMASRATYESVNAIAGRDGIIVSEGAPVTSGQVSPGQVRVVVTRSEATVPGCPDWSTTSDINYGNGRVETGTDLAMKFWGENGETSYPWKSLDTWFMTENIRWGYFPADTDVKALVDATNRSDLWIEAAAELGIDTSGFGDSRGVETFFDGKVFDPADPQAYLDSLEIKSMA